MAIHWMPWCWAKARVSADDRAGARDCGHADARRQRHRRQDSCPSASGSRHSRTTRTSPSCPPISCARSSASSRTTRSWSTSRSSSRTCSGPEAITIINDALDLYRKLHAGARRRPPRTSRWSRRCERPSMNGGARSGIKRFSMASASASAFQSSSQSQRRLLSATRSGGFAQPSRRGADFPVLCPAARWRPPPAWCQSGFAGSALALRRRSCRLTLD